MSTSLRTVAVSAKNRAFVFWWSFGIFFWLECSIVAENNTWHYASDQYSTTPCFFLNKKYMRLTPLFDYFKSRINTNVSALSLILFLIVTSTSVSILKALTVFLTILILQSSASILSDMLEQNTDNSATYHIVSLLTPLSETIPPLHCKFAFTENEWSH